MTTTYDLSTLIGKARLYSKDTTLTSVRFSDEEIQGFLDMEGSDPRLAAAVSLELTAVDQALLAKVTQVGDIKLDGSTVAESLISQANNLRRLVRISRTGASASLEMVSRLDTFPLI